MIFVRGVVSEAEVLADGDGGDLDSVLNDPDSSNFSFSETGGLGESIEAAGGIEKSCASSGDDSFGEGGLGGTESISDSVLDLSNFNLTSPADLDHSDAALQFGQSLF